MKVCTQTLNTLIIYFFYDFTLIPWGMRMQWCMYSHPIYGEKKARVIGLEPLIRPH